MKKVLIFGVVALTLFVTGCTVFSIGEKTITCTKTLEEEEYGYTYDSEYKVTYDDTTVNKLQNTYKITSDDSTILDTFEESFANTYSELQTAYSGVNYEVENTGSYLKFIVTFDYTKMDLEQFSKDTSDFNGSIVDGHVDLDSLQKSFELSGYTCN